MAQISRERLIKRKTTSIYLYLIWGIVFRSWIYAVWFNWLFWAQQIPKRVEARIKMGKSTWRIRLRRRDRQNLGEITVPISKFKFGYFKLKLELLDTWLVTVFVLEPQLVYTSFEEERCEVVDQAEEEKIDAEEDACCSEVCCTILCAIIDGRAEIDLVHIIIWLMVCEWFDCQNMIDITSFLINEQWKEAIIFRNTKRSNILYIFRGSWKNLVPLCLRKGRRMSALGWLMRFWVIIRSR